MGAGLECVKLLATEVLTPASNWSSYPPHKHDENQGSETELEEVYYYRFASAAPIDEIAARQAKAVGYQRVYGTAERPIELLEEVTDGDTVLIPHGWHGPSIASPSHHMYYLNVMAGPGAERAWGISDDPNHGWVRQTWESQPTDPRLPFYTAPDSSSDPGPSNRRATVTSAVSPQAGETIRLTVAQAVVKFLGQQYSERDGVRRKFFAGCFGIFGHGNVAGLGQALLQSELLTPGELPYHQGRNEQAMVHIAVGTPGSWTGCRPSRSPRRWDPGPATC